MIPFLLTLIYFAPQAPPVTASIEGIVIVLRTGSRVAGAHVSIAGPQLAQADADQNGHFAIRDLQPGKYRAQATLRGYTASQLTRGTSLDIGPVQQLKGVVIALVPEGLIAGHVSDSNGDPVANVNVEALKYAYQGWPANPDSCH